MLQCITPRYAPSKLCIFDRKANAILSEVCHCVGKLEASRLLINLLPDSVNLLLFCLRYFSVPCRPLQPLSAQTPVHLSLGLITCAEHLV